MRTMLLFPSDALSVTAIRRAWKPSADAKKDVTLTGALVPSRGFTGSFLESCRVAELRAPQGSSSAHASQMSPPRPSSGGSSKSRRRTRGADGEPHQHRREVERHQRQAIRAAGKTGTSP